MGGEIKKNQISRGGDSIDPYTCVCVCVALILFNYVEGGERSWKIDLAFFLFVSSIANVTLSLLRLSC